jgi:hypothetical protein
LAAFERNHTERRTLRTPPLAGFIGGLGGLRDCQTVF